MSTLEFGELSAGRAATVNIASAMIPPTRFTTDSTASDSKPTEPVIKYATDLSPMVMTAAAMDSQAKRVSEEQFKLDGLKHLTAPSENKNHPVANQDRPIRV